MDALICRENCSAPFADYGCQMMPASVHSKPQLHMSQTSEALVLAYKKQPFLSQTNRGGLFVDLPKV